MKTELEEMVNTDAYRKKYISKGQLLKLAEPMAKTDYGKYLLKVAEEI